MSASQAHSSEHNEHYTPKWLIDIAHAVLDGIELDPMSSHKANELVQAARIGTIDTPASWRARSAWLNPPGGKLDPTTLQPVPRNANGIQGGPGISQAGQAWCELESHVRNGRLESALFLAFSINVFRTAQDRRLRVFYPDTLSPIHYPVCIFRERIRFDTIVDGVRKPGRNPPQDSALVLLPGLHSNGRAERQFNQLLSSKGAVRIS